jgi:nitrate reductase gamma subunit
MSALLKILPLSIVMVAGPQIITPFLLATSEKARKNLLAYLAGSLAGTVVVTSVIFLVADALDVSSDRESSSGSTTVDWVLLVLLVVAAIHVYRTRNTKSAPKWMSGLMTAEPKSCFLLGLALLSIFPTDLMMNLTVGVFLASGGDPLWYAVPFWALTTLFLAVPLLVLLLLGKRAETTLPAARHWMESNSWVVSEFVIALFVVIELQSIVSA